MFHNHDRGVQSFASRWGAKSPEMAPSGVQICPKRPKVGCIVSFKPILAKKERAIALSFFGTPEGTQLYSPSASYIGYASYICFASDIGLRPALEANII